MSSTIIINFYDSIANIPLSIKTLTKLKEFIAEKFQLIPSDVEEFDFYYFNENKEKVFIGNNLGLVRSLFQLKSIKEETQRVIHIALREGSRLYREMFNEEDINAVLEDSPSQVEKIKTEISLKEKELKEILEKERIEAIKAEEQKKEIQLALEKQAIKKAEALELLSKQREEIMQKAKQESLMIEKKIKENKSKEDKQKAKEEKKKDEKAKVKKIDAFIEIEKITKNISKFAAKAVDKTFVKIDSAFQKIKENKKIKPVHEGVRCDGCKTKNFTGIRYKCTVCPDFDFCEDCEEKNFSNHLHPFVKIRNPDINVNVKVELNDTIKQESTEKKENFALGYINKIVSNVDLFINSLTETNYHKQAQEMKGKYDLEIFGVDQIALALKETKGDEDLALCKLIQ